ncbi:MAG: hypothetical protein ABIE22_02775 [archaeon]
MTLEIVMPESNVKNRTTKDLVFTILVEDSPKTLTQLHREIKRKYSYSVTFQAVIKAVNSLLLYGVIVKAEKLYSINKDWIFETRNFLDKLYKDQFEVKKPMKKIELGKEITVYTLGNLLELDRLWFELLMNWAKKEEKDKRNCWRGSHAWWLLPRLHEEDILHDFMIKKGIKTYNLWLSNTLLDKLAVKYYKDKKEFVKITNRVKLDSDSHITVFGDKVVKFEIPKQISDKLNKLYSSTKKLEKLDIKKTIDIFKENTEIEFTVIKDKLIADKIKEEIISYF